MTARLVTRFHRTFIGVSSDNPRPRFWMDLGISAERMSMRSTTGLVLMLIGLLLLGGCHSQGPSAQDGFIARPVSSHTALNSTFGTGNQLQVVVCYGKTIDTHAALRVTLANGQAVFWDPGGDYQADNPWCRRADDLMVECPPSLGQYWYYRRTKCRGTEMHVFEWDISAFSARRKRDALLSGTSEFSALTPELELDGEEAFSTMTRATMCSLAVSRFLMKFAQSEIGLKNQILLPYDLAKRMWREQPDRVWKFTGMKTPMIFTQPDRASIATSSETVVERQN